MHSLTGLRCAYPFPVITLKLNEGRSTASPFCIPNIWNLVWSICCWVSLLDSQQVPFKLECSEWCVRPVDHSESSFSCWHDLVSDHSNWGVLTPYGLSQLLQYYCQLLAFWCPLHFPNLLCSLHTPESSPLSLGVYLCLLGVFMLISTVV